MAIITAIVLIATGMVFGWSGWTVLRGRNRQVQPSASAYNQTPFNRALLFWTARIAIVFGPAFALLGAAMLLVEMS
ncbi:hypothetical protein [Erythrobacter rubeus]|uniref:Uncharacterized protein n=1 Tax=Erythrobacter rubeus TaxID=2760803 RepID=A0ABR8KXQ4_9SPHN|nr:hypothetical protein [Erythrobacter rubeus]MBD2842941.1 hypothetical protein [Erythrobacter rubeus]